LYDGSNIIQELSGRSPTANLLTGFGIDEIFTRTDSSGTGHLMTDALNSTIALLDGNGTMLSQFTYEPFGKTTAMGAGTTDSFQYTGRENDNTGLYYYRARYYDPSIGRFISEDPIGFGGGTNFYAYVHNRPTMAVDPSGQVTVIPLPAANVHFLSDIDPNCGVTAGGCNKVNYSPEFACEGECGGWRARFTIKLTGDIYVATGPYPYKGRPARDRSVVDAASAKRHEDLHTDDKVNAIRRIFGQVEARLFQSQQACIDAAVAAEVQAGPAWDQASRDSQRRRN
jgi:RHS repeat-associated protein